MKRCFLPRQLLTVYFRPIIRGRRAFHQFHTMSKHERSKSQEDVLRHPPAKRAREIDEHPPLQELLELVKKTEGGGKPRNVLHWFRSKDIRLQDNHALHEASKKAQEGSGHLIGLYLFAPADMEWHGTSPARVNFVLESLRDLQSSLKDKNIPLAIVVAEERAQKVDKVLDFVTENDVSHVYGNLEYEVDELRRDIKMAKKVSESKDLSLTLVHDQTIMPPGEIRGNSGPMKVFTPYHKAWLSEVSSNADLLKPYPDPESNDKSATSDLKSLFDHEVPSAPESKRFASKDEEARIRKLWPAGHKAGIDRLTHFLTKKASQYAATRSNPGKDSSSRMSPYLASGIVGIRETLSLAAEHSGAQADFDAGDAGVNSWVREVVFREFYRSTLAGSPHDAMNLPHNLKFDKVEWEDDEEGWRKWKEGKTGAPLVDAGMRQLAREAWMHNRARMNVSSYLYINLLLDYRRGERYFAENLVDWDLANNTNGWEPSYTAFNPVSQAERNDPEGEYIRRWVPELKDVKGKAIFSPFERLSKEEFEKTGYVKPHVDFAETKDRAIQRFKRDLHSGE